MYLHNKHNTKPKINFKYSLLHNFEKRSFEFVVKKPCVSIDAFS